MYGTTKAWADALRSFEGGRLADNSAEGEPQFPERNTIRLSMANPPNPAENKYRDVNRFFSKFQTCLNRLLFSVIESSILYLPLLTNNIYYILLLHSKGCISYKRTID